MGLVVVVGGVVVLSGGEPDEPPVTELLEPAGPDEGGPDDASGRGQDEVRTEDEVAADAVVASKSTSELPEDIYCWWDGAEVEKCHVWAVESDLAPFSHVVAAGERVIVAVEDAVVALDGSDGAVLWTWRDEVPTLVAATPDRVFVTDGGGRTVALDAATGRQAWDAELREGRWLWQSVRDGVMVNREPSSMAMFSVEDGALLWEQSVQAAGADGTPVIADEVIMTVAGERLVGYSRADGEQLWQTPLTPTLPPVHWPRDDVVIVAEDDQLSAVEVATGAQLWTLPTEGVEHLADVDADTVAVSMPDRVDLVDRYTGTIVTPVHAPALRAIHATPDGAFLAKAGTTSVQRWQTEPLRSTWNLHARMPMYATYAAIDLASGPMNVVAPIADGATLVAFDVSARDSPARRSVPACEGAHPSWHLDRLTAWAGEVAHVALVTAGQQERRLWIGLPGQDPATTTFSVSARPLNTTGEARFSHLSEDWREELVVDSMGRTEEGFPPHWVVVAEFPQPGCWEIRIVGDQVDDTVVIPVPAASGASD